MGKGRGYAGGMPGGMNMNNILKQAQKMQQQMEDASKELETKVYEATAGGGAVKAIVSGKKELTEIVIDKDVVDPDDVEMLQDLIMAAVNEAYRQAEKAQQDTMGRITGMGGGLGF